MVDAADDLRLRGHDLELLPLVHDVAIGRGADPAPLLLPPADDGADLLAGVGDGHLVDEELKLDLEPIVVVGEVDVVPDGEDAHPGVAQVLQLHEAPAVPARKARKVLDDQQVQLVRHEQPAHPLIPLALLKRVARAVAVLEKVQLAAREMGADVFPDDALLVLDGDVVPVQLLVHGDAAVARDSMDLRHFPPPPFPRRTRSGNARLRSPSFLLMAPS